MAANASIDQETLSWVSSEIGSTLTQAKESLDQAANSGGQDVTGLRICANHLHQVVGTLQMVELKTLSAMVLQAEELADALADNEVEKPFSETIDVLNRVLEQLSVSLERLKKGLPALPVQIVELLNEIREIRGKEAVQISSLFSPDIDIYPTISSEHQLSEQQYQVRVAQSRKLYHHKLLQWLKGIDEVKSMERIKFIFEKLYEISNFGSVARLWWVAVAYSDYLLLNKIESKKLHVRIFSQLNDNLRSLAKRGESALLTDPAEELVKIMLFYVGISEKHSESIGRIRGAYSLHDYFPADDDSEESGHINISADVLHEVRKNADLDMSKIMRMLDHYFNEDDGREIDINVLQSKMLALANAARDTKAKILAEIADEIFYLVAQVDKNRIDNKEDASIQLAAALMYVDQGLSTEDDLDNDWLINGKAKLRALKIVAGREVDDVEEEDTTGAERKQLLGIISQEAGENLNYIEKNLEQYVRQDFDVSLIEDFPNRIDQIRGALQIIGEQKVSLLLKLSGEQFKALVAKEVKPKADLLEALAVSVGATDAYVKGLLYGGKGQDELLDRSITDLELAIGKKITRADVESLLERSSSSMTAWLADVADHELQTKLRSDLRDISMLARKTKLSSVEHIVVEQTRLLDVVASDAEFMSEKVVTAFKEAMANISMELVDLYGTEETEEEKREEEEEAQRKSAIQASEHEKYSVKYHDDMDMDELSELLDGGPDETESATEKGKKYAVEADEQPLIDEEIKEIFIEECRLVLQQADELYEMCSKNKEDSESIKELRRQFHTLKGSGRMAGVTKIGEVNWFAESIFNYILDTDKPVTDPVLEFAKDVLELTKEHLENNFDTQHTIDLTPWGKRADKIAVTALTEEKTDESSETSEKEESALGGNSPLNDDGLREVFLNEANTNLQIIFNNLEKISSGETKVDNALYVAIHTLGGNGRTLEITKFAAAYKIADEIVDYLREEDMDVPPKVTEILTKLAEETEESLSSLKAGQFQPILENPKWGEITEALKLEMNEYEDKAEELIASNQEVAQEDEFDKEVIQETSSDELELAVEESEEIRESEVKLEFEESDGVSDEEIVQGPSADTLEFDVEEPGKTTVSTNDLALNEEESELEGVGVVLEVDTDELEFSVEEESTKTTQPQGIELDLNDASNGSVLELDIDSDANEMELEPMELELEPMEEEIESGYKVEENDELQKKNGLLPDVSDLLDDEVSAEEVSEDVSEIEIETDTPIVLEQQADDEIPEVGSNENVPEIEIETDVDEDGSIVLEQQEEGEELDEIRSIFCNEARSVLERFDSSVHSLNQDDSMVPILNSVMRDLHTLKGSARMAGLENFGDVAHHAEDFVTSVLNVGESITAEQSKQTKTVLQEIHDSFLQAINDVENGQKAVFESSLMNDLSNQLHASVEEITKQADKKILEVSDLLVETSEMKLEDVEGESSNTDIQTDSDEQELLNTADIDEELLDIFCEEGQEVLSNLNQTLEAWKSRNDWDVAQKSILRDLHTLKGSARMAGQESIASVAHILETVVESAKLKNKDQHSSLHKKVEEIHDLLLVDVHNLEARKRPHSHNELIEELENFDFSGSSKKTKSSKKKAQKASNKSFGQQDNVIPQVIVQSEAKVAASAAQQRFAEGTAVKASPAMRIETATLNNLSNFVGDVGMTRVQLTENMNGMKGTLDKLQENVKRFSTQLRALEIEADTQISARSAEKQQVAHSAEFDPLELDRYTKLQQLSRGLVENLDELTNIESNLGLFTHRAESTLQQQDRLNRDLQDQILQVRLVPFGGVAPQLRQVVRQTIKQLNKEVEFEVVGADVRLDKSVLDGVTPALEHMLRNALDHGIEGPEVRVQKGKDKAGKVTIECRQVAREILIRIIDDGKGLDIDKIRNKAEQQGLIEPGANLDGNQIMTLISASGFSTSDNVTQISGRGVGMDVVQTSLRGLSGSIQYEFNDEHPGSVSVIRLPISLAVTGARYIRSGGRRFAVSMRMIERVINLDVSQIRELFEHEVEPIIKDRDEDFLLVNLADHLSLESAIPESGKLPVLLVYSGTQNIAVVIDEILDTQEIVVKPLGTHLGSIPIYSGATLRADGEVILILDLIGISYLESAGILIKSEKAVEQKVITAMVVDDSLTVRKATQRDVGNMGIEVILAKDGLDAQEQLVAGAKPDIVLLDLEMPRMDGFELLGWVRKESDVQGVPVVIISSRSAEKHIEKAKSLGANHFLGKPYRFEDLVDTFNRFLDLNYQVEDDDS